MPTTYESVPDARGWRVVPDPAGTDAVVETRLCELGRLAWLLDARFRIPGTDWRIGLDALLGAVPVIGDSLPALAGAWIIVRSAQLGVPRSTLARMAANLLVDTVAGSVPLIGDLFDVAFKANLRNLDLLHAYFGRPPLRR